MFAMARPIWAQGREKESNLFLRFRCMLPRETRLIRLTASTAYQLMVNGKFISYGPARAGEGYFRVDEWEIAGGDQEFDTEILVAGYYLGCFEYALNPSFLQMEALNGAGEILFATGRDEISAVEYGALLRRVDRFARQRVNCEIYDLRKPDGECRQLCIVDEPMGYLPRRVAPFSNDRYFPAAYLQDMQVEKGKVENAPSPFDHLFLHSPTLPIYTDYECCLFQELKALQFSDSHAARGETELKAGQARLLSYDCCRAGLLEMIIEAEEESEIYLQFDEILVDGDLQSHRFNCVNGMKIIVPAGKHFIRSFEPYTLKYLKISVTKGSVRRILPCILEIAAPKVENVAFQDPELQMIYDAAVNTYRQNATDIFMDCPSRERAGWLCDSFFTGRVEYALTGKNDVEHNFLENYLHTAPFRLISPIGGMLPMCYPSSHDYMDFTGRHDNCYIPNWAMWFVMELEEFIRLRHGDRTLADDLRQKMDALLNGFSAYENEDGLLEDLPGWVFVEWSRANDKDVVCGVNYPTNMLYAGALDAAGRLYQNEKWSLKAEKIRKLIQEKAWNGKWFVDNAIRENGKLKNTKTTTEVCQYYAFYFGIATKDEHKELLSILLEDFGPQRHETNLHPDVHFANAFIGNYLRLDILYREKEYPRMLQEIKGYFSMMARQTGSLWEFDRPSASCCHGFASYVACWLKDLKEKLHL
ncbi:MAG: hypothetical protein E7336_11655 [Clostridiales bacterium]|nr:hypothetical protein [Clostridiales bacterium]